MWGANQSGELQCQLCGRYTLLVFNPPLSMQYKSWPDRYLPALGSVNVRFLCRHYEFIGTLTGSGMGRSVSEISPTCSF